MHIQLFFLVQGYPSDVMNLEMLIMDPSRWSIINRKSSYFNWNKIIEYIFYYKVEGNMRNLLVIKCWSAKKKNQYYISTMTY